MRQEVLARLVAWRVKQYPRGQGRGVGHEKLQGSVAEVQPLHSFALERAAVKEATLELLYHAQLFIQNYLFLIPEGSLARAPQRSPTEDVLPDLQHFRVEVPFPGQNRILFMSPHHFCFIIVPTI
jgi:hypothetical protein